MGKEREIKKTKWQKEKVNLSFLNPPLFTSIKLNMKTSQIRRTIEAHMWQKIEAGNDSSIYLILNSCVHTSDWVV